MSGVQLNSNSEVISPPSIPCFCFMVKGCQQGPKLQGRIPVKFCHTCQVDAHWEGGSVLVTPVRRAISKLSCIVLYCLVYETMSPYCPKVGPWCSVVDNTLGRSEEESKPILVAP